MRPRIRHVALFLFAAAALPLATDAGIAVPPASKVPACMMPDPPFPRMDGDEKFFNIPGGVPNVMMLLDTSGSMLEFPRTIAWQGFTLTGTTYQTTGTCGLQTPFVNDTIAYNIADAKYDVPYDNGYSTTLVTDNPPWGLTRCAAKQARPATDGAIDWCLYRSDSYYKFVNGASALTGTFWSQTSATVYNANPCSVVSTGGAVQRDSTNAVVTANVASCNACLSSKGYYIFAVRYKNASNAWVTSPEQIVFSGRFLNAFPQKHIAARKVVKDTVKLDPTSATTTDSVRFGLTVFVSTNTGGFSTSLRTNDGGKLVVPLGPNCSQSFPVTSAAFAPARQAIIDAVNAIDASGNPTQIPFGGSTPLAEALFNIGQYFTNTGTSSLYGAMFGSGWVRSSFAENAAGSMNVSWAQAGMNQHSFCWACQQSSVVVVTDGAPNQDSNLPLSGVTTAHATFNNDFRYWSNPAIDCPGCKCDLSYGGSGCTTPSPLVPSGGVIPNMMHKVSYFLKQTDLRPDLANGAQPQNVATYTISFGVDASATNSADDKAALAVLQKTADLGGGLFFNTSSGEELRTALNTAVTDVVSKSTSFSSANANALQTSRTNQADAYVARFKPNDASMWEGHLFAAMLFDEFGQGCDSHFPTSGQKLITCGTKSGVNPNLNGDSDTDGKALCTGAYLVDKDCDPLVEDSNGNYKKGIFVGGVLNSTPDDANVFWDAGRVLSDPAQTGYTTAEEGKSNSRKILTTIDVNGDGKLDASDGTVEFTAANAAALAPFMSLDKDFCLGLLKSAGMCGASPLPACFTTFTATDQASCAAVVINYFRGWDVLDQDGDHCAGPGAYYNTHPWGSCTSNASCGSGATCVSNQCVNSSCPNGEQRDRPNDSRPSANQQFWKLGDIFHSSPFLVRRPIDKLLCTLGGSLFVQCAQTIFSPTDFEGTPTPLANYGGLDAYDAWRVDEAGRPQFVLVGANDGMLHSFHAGAVDTSKPKDSEGMYPYDNGTGTELWAYIPSDLLPKLKLALGSHQYFVDGTTMVRDVWVDLNGDGVKQKNEFRTVAVIAERAGGSRWTALDVTNPAQPTFLWTFPDGCTEDSVLAGESWAEFLPRPPPIGPVRLAAPPATDPTGRGYEERWVVMLNGGYDPTLVRGRAVWMLDVYRGTKLWRYTDADFKAMRGDTKASMFPVAATIGMSDVGRLDRTVGNPQTDGMFDTATWGDVGGNIFVARFYDPGILGGNGMVANWTAARSFEQARQDDDRQLAPGRSPYFHLTANVPQHPRALRVLVGSGNRNQLMQPQPACGPDDMFGCAQAGCSAATAAGSVSYGSPSCSAATTFNAASGVLSYGPDGSTACAGSFSAPSPVDRKTTVTATCGTDSLSQTAERTCDSTGICAQAGRASPPTYQDKAFAAGTTFVPKSLPNPCTPNRFVSLWAYGMVATKRFSTVAQAKTFDANRFTDVASGACSDWPGGSCRLVEVSNAQVKLDARGNFSPVCMDGAAKCKADGTDPGWMFTYGNFCPLGPGKCASTPPWCDERTGSQPGGAFNCVIWSGFRPTGSVGGTDPCTSSAGSPTAFTYFADYFSGIPTISTSSGRVCGIVNDPFNTTQVLRGKQKDAFSVPQSAMLRVSVNDKGQVGYSALSIEAGSAPEKFQLGTRSSAAEPLYWLEVPREVHTCRHVDPSACK